MSRWSLLYAVSWLLLAVAAAADLVHMPDGIAVAATIAGSRPATRPERRARTHDHGLPNPKLMSLEQLMAESRQHMRAQERSARRWRCTRPGCNGRPHEGWRHRHARASQRKPTGNWQTWLMLTGRGWGKTRTAAETVREWVNESDRPLHIAVIAKKETLVREVCFQHRRSGLLAIFPEDEIARYDKSVGAVTLTLKNGTVIRGFGANEPDNFRGYEFDKVWCDEFAAWNRHVAQESLDTVWFCLRESKNPQVVISTTPKPLPHIKKLLREHDDEVAEIAESGDPDREPGIRITRGSMADNRDNLSLAALKVLTGAFGKSRMGDQELDGILLEDVEGALWSQALFEWEGFRVGPKAVPDLEEIVVAVDPSVTSTETADANGMAVVGRSYPYGTVDEDARPHGFVLHSEARRSTPRQTMVRAAELYHLHQADAVVFEVNNGGDYLPALMYEVDHTVICRVVNATRDKRSRAAPVAALYEQARIHHVGTPAHFDELETVMTTYVGAPESQEKSPDILDALVWAVTELFLSTSTPTTRLRTKDKRLKGRR